MRSLERRLERLEPRTTRPQVRVVYMKNGEEPADALLREGLAQEFTGDTLFVEYVSAGRAA